MSFIKKLLVVLLSATCIIACAFGITACSPDKSNTDNTGDTGNTGNTGITGEHTFAEGWTGDSDYHWHASTDGSDAVDGKALHDWTVVESKSTAASCSAAGQNVYKCSVCGLEKTETVAQLSHDWSDIKTDAATCTTAGSKYIECLNDGCGAKQTVEIIPATGHITDGHATCTEGVKCSVCDSLVEPATGHHYELTYSESATCTEAGHAHYECTGCGDSYQTVTETAKGHVIVWNAENKKTKGTADACYVILGECIVCGESGIESETAVGHVFKSTISNAATCSHSGEKTYTCECGYHYTVEYTDKDAHDWGTPVISGNIATYTCTHDGAHTKSAVISAETSAYVAVSDLTTAGSVNLAGTSIALDDGVKNTIAGKDTVQLTADTLSASDLELGNQAQLLKDAQVYNLTLNIGGQNISELGGTVTVTVPYTLEADDDPDNIVVWYINGTELEEIQGKYSNGYVIFETNHFSYYTVTRMTPAQRCEMYGHAYETVTEAPTCLLAGYEMQFCTRCGKYEKTDIPALGHEWHEHLTPATCTANGKAEYECETCGASYEVIIPSTGHSWTVTDKVEATCEHAGYAKYICDICGETYEITEAQKSHSFKVTVVAPTCTEGGYTINKCVVCGLESITDYTEALGHTIATKTVAPTCTLQGYTITYCTVCGEEISKGNFVDATGHNVVNGVCTVCGDGCKHSYTAGEKVAATCTEGGYTVYTCTNCGTSYKGDITEALGHDFGVEECSRCHAPNPAVVDYYLNFIKTTLEGSISIKLSGLSVVQTEENVTIKGSESTSQTEQMFSIEQLDIIELNIALSENGTLVGSGKAKICQSTSYDTITMDCLAALKDETIYIIVETDNASLVPSMYLTISLDYALGGMSNGELTYQKLKDYLIWYNTEVKTVLDKVLSENGNIAAAAVKFVLNNLFDCVATADGYTYTVNFDKVTEYNELLYTVTVKDIVDGILGKGIYESLPGIVNTLLTLTPEQALTILGGYGFNKSQICVAVDAFVYLLTGENISSEKLLNELLENGYKDATVADFIIAYFNLELTREQLISEIAQNVPEILGMYKDYTVYDIIAESTQTSAEDIYENVTLVIDEYLTMLTDSAQISFSTDKAGNIVSAKIVADIEDLLVGGGSYGGSVGIGQYEYWEDGHSYVVYLISGEMIAVEIDGVLYDADGNVCGSISEIIDSLELERYEFHYYISIGGTAEFVFNGNVSADENVISAVTSSMPVFGKNEIITLYSEKQYEYDYDELPSFFTSESGSELRIHTDENGKIVKIVETREVRNRSVNRINGLYVDCYEYMTSSVYEYYVYNGGISMLNKNYCKDIDAYTVVGSYIFNRNEQNTRLIVHKDTGVIISDAVIFNNDYSSRGSNSSIMLYYNTVTKEFYNTDPHYNLVLNEAKSKIECGGYYYYECADCGYASKHNIYHLGDYNANFEYELVHGEGSSCTGGVIEKHVCPDCGETVSSHTYYSHQTMLIGCINLADYGSVCNHTIEIYGCVCGEYEYTNTYYGQYGLLGNDWDSITYTLSRIDDGNGNYIDVILYTCFVTDCNFSFAFYTTYDKDENCYSYRVEHWLLGVTLDELGRTVSGGTEITLSRPDGYDHNNTSVTEQTANGTITTYKCADCGLITRTVEQSAIYDSLGRRLSETQINSYYLNNVNNNVISSVEKSEYLYEYNADGNILKSTAIRTSYSGEMLEQNITSKTKTEESYTYNADGSRNTYKTVTTRYYGDSSSVVTNEYMYVMGYRFNTLSLSEEYDENGELVYWHKYEYIYNDGKYCSPMIQESTIYGESVIREGVVNHVASGDYLTYPTCTQSGTQICLFCGEIAQTVAPLGHHYINGVCEHCGLENAGADGRVIFEDMSYTSDSDYVIGYYNWDTANYEIYISLVYTDDEGYEDNIILFNLVYTDERNYDYYGSGKILFSIADIEMYASENGLEDYMIRVTFSPEYFGSELDYSITIDVHQWTDGILLLPETYDATGNRIEASEVSVKYCPECKLINNYGYLYCQTGYYDTENEVYVYYGYCTGNGNTIFCSLITSAPLDGVNIEEAA